MKQTTKNILGVGAIILLSSGVAGLTTYKLLQSNESAKETSFNEMFKQNPNVKLAAFDAVNAQPVDLTQAAENSLHAVVHIRSTQEAKTRTVQQAPDIFDFFFGDGRGQQRQVQSQPRVGFGSGVIISKDGYIVTNNHVIEGADEISVKLNDNREFKGRVIGTDPSTDLALVKIEGDDFPTIPVGDSEALKVGEWVLAKEGFPVAVGPSFGHATKYELRNKSFTTPGILAKAGCQVSIITDAPVIPQQYLALCAGLAVKSGMDEFDALKAITINPAKHLMIEKRVGSIEVGKDADFAICDGNIMKSDSVLKYTIIDGKVVFKHGDM